MKQHIQYVARKGASGFYSLFYKGKDVTDYGIRLVVSVKPGDKLIQTTHGQFKVRKNGRVIIQIDKEILRVTPIRK